MTGARFRANSTGRGVEMKGTKFLSLMLALVFALAACSPAATPTAAPTEAPVVSAPGFPTGRFIQSGSKEYGITFNEDGTFSVGNSASTFVTGTYTADDKVFTETSNTGGCKTNVSFYYTFDGTNLTFTYVGKPENDADCTGRYADFNNVTYTLSK
jgi:hypothetical protein